MNLTICPICNHYTHSPECGHDAAQRSRADLFKDASFKPAWVKRAEEDARMELDIYVTKGVEIEWKDAAKKSHEAILKRYGRGMNRS